MYTEADFLTYLGVNVQDRTAGVAIGSVLGLLGAALVIGLGWMIYSKYEQKKREKIGHENPRDKIKPKQIPLEEKIDETQVNKRLDISSNRQSPKHQKAN